MVEIIIGIAAVLGIIYLMTRPKKVKGIIGDLDNDGYLTSKDIEILEKYIAGYSISEISSLSEDEFLYRADVNGDGVISIVDITALEIRVGG